MSLQRVLPCLLPIRSKIQRAQSDLGQIDQIDPAQIVLVQIPRATVLDDSLVHLNPALYSFRIVLLPNNVNTTHEIIFL